MTQSMPDLTKPYSLTAPPVLDFMAPARVLQWFVPMGHFVAQGQSLVVLTDGLKATLEMLSPADAILDSIKIYANEYAPTGKEMARLLVAADYQVTTQRDWANFDKLSDILASFSDKTKDAKQLRDMNDALGELLGVKDDAVFQKMNTDQQNFFIQEVVGQYQEKGLSPVAMAQKMLEGLQLRTPQIGPAFTGPAMGFRPSAPGMGMGGGGMGGARTAYPSSTQDNQPMTGTPPQLPNEEA